MFRVAGVALTISNSSQKRLGTNSMVSACLLHDMGNIIKFNLESFPKHFRDKGLKYWEGVQNKFRHDYGEDEHKATYKICKEIGINNNIFQLIKGFGFPKGEETYKSNNFEIKISSYSDMRVTPYGVDTLQNRLDEAWQRYKTNPKYSTRFETLRNFWKKTEEQIFFHCKIGPNDITANKIEKLVGDLKNIDIEVK